MNMKLGNCACVIQFNIYITLWRNDGFLHSFRNFSKSNAFRKNLIRKEFILRKIFFQMSILLNSKPHGCASIYFEKIAKNHLQEDTTILRGRECLATKINITIFVGNEVLNIFHLTIFSEKKTIFSKINMKNNF